MEAWKEWLKMLTWLKVKYYLKKSWIWIKAHWEIVLGAILVIFVYATQRAKTSSMSKVLETSRKIHEEEINALHEIHEKEKEDLKKAEDRKLFKSSMEKIGVNVCPSGIASTLEEALEVGVTIGAYPRIIRPAFTLGGSGGGIAYNEEEYFNIC